MKYLGLQVADWLVLAVYLVGVTAIGVWSFKKVHDMSDFFMGGRRFGKVFMMFFAFGAGTSSEQAVSVVAGTWRAGLAGIWWQFLWLWATPFYWIVAPVMRRMRALTTSDFFQARYDTSTATLYSVFGIIMSIVFIAGGLYGSGKMVNALTGGELDRVSERIDIQVPALKWNPETKAYESQTRPLQGYELAILAMTVMFVTYGMAGGLGAAIITDFIQGILTITFSFMLLPFAFEQIGGKLNSEEGLAVAEIKQGMFELFGRPEVAQVLGKEPITIFYVCMLSLTALTGIVVQPHIMGVCGAGKTEFEGRFGFTFGNFLKRFCTLAWTFTGLVCIVWYLSPTLSPLDEATRLSLTPGSATYDAAADSDFADQLFGRAAYDILPTIAPGLVGLLLASLLAAIMSTSDAQMVVSSGLFTENIYKRFFVRNKSQKHYLWVGRISGLIIVMLALILQAGFTDVIDALKVIIKTPAAIGISLWFGIVWRGWTPLAVWGSTFTTAGTWYYVSHYPETFKKLGLEVMLNESQTKVLDSWQMCLFMAAGAISGLLISLITPRVKKDKLDHFFRLIHTPVRDGEHIETPCTLPEDPLPQMPKLFNSEDIELPKPTLLGMGGFVVAWILVGLIVWLTQWLATSL